MIPKFRAWSTDKKIMAEVRTLRFTDELVETDKFVERSIEGVKLMQSTGFEDNLGDVIFEGDIILWTYWDGFEDSGSAKIIFDNGMFKLLDIYTEKEVWDNLFDCNENCDIYIKGNIYENPELLEVTK